MGVQVADHAANSRIKQLGVINRLNVFALDTLHDLGEQAGLLHGLFIVANRLPVGQKAAAKRQAQAHDGADNYNQNRSGFQ